mmetsp:Transcript_5014/g.12304  ORF Transcript_5014/g.12304 Transcript_5014/m.12304 type:complete len:256 (-) Transcript_5014:57-824(-)
MCFFVGEGEREGEREREIDPRSTTAANAKANANANANASASTATGFICKDVVMERDPTIAATKRKSFRRKTRANTHDARHASAVMASASASAAASAMAIEGYTPSTAPIGTQSPRAAAAATNSIPPNSGREGTDKDNNNNNNNHNHNHNNNHHEGDDEPLVIDSLEGLMRAAGESLPEHPDVINPDAKVVEANISFSVMTQDQYQQGLPDLKQQQAEEQRRQLDVFLGKRNIFGDDDDDDDGNGNGNGNRSRAKE